MTKIATYADNTNTPNDALAPSVADYLAAGVTGVDTANLNAVNAGVDAVASDDVDTVAEIQAIAAAGNTTADAAMTKIATYADNTNTPNDALAPSVADYLAAGVTGVDAANLNAVNAGVDAVASDDVDTVAEIQAIAAAGNTTADAAMTKIATYADNTNTPNDALAPSVADYLAAGVTGVDAANLNAVNAGVDAVASDDVDTVAEIQAIAAAGNTTADAAMTKIATYADNTNTPNDALAPSVADYLAAGVTGVDTANLNAVNAGVDATNKDGVDTVAEIQAIAAAGNTTADAAMTKIATYADNTNTPNDALAPSVADYLAAGVTGVDTANLNAVNAGVDAVASDDVDTVAEIQAIAAAGNTTADAAMTKIATYADNTNTPNDALAPSVADYLAAGVTGVDTANLNAVNAGVDAVASDDVDTVAEIQAIAAAGNTTADAAMTKIATYADNTNTPNDALAPSVADYLAAGVTGVDAANLNAVNAGVDATNKDGVDTVAEIQAIAAAGNTTADAAMTKIATYADNTNTPNDALAPSVADYLAAGVTGVDAANLNAVNAGVDAVASDDVDTVAEIQAIAAAGNTTADAAMTKIATYADNTNTPNDALAPSVADYLAAGVTGVDTANLNAVNAGVDAVASDDVDTVAEIQAIAAAGNTTADAAMTKIATYADNTNTPNDALAPSVADYLAAGVTGVDTANLNAVNAGVDAVASDDVDTVAEIQAIAAAGNTTADAAMTKIATYADNTNTPNDALAPSVADYLAAGVTGVDTANLNAVNAGVDAVASDDVDTVAEIQAIAAAGNTTADAAMTKIATYADNTNTPNDALAPSVADYLAAGVTGVDTANLNAVNAGVDAVASDDVDTVAEIQAIAAAGNTTADAAMTKIATYADNTNTPNDALAPSVADYLAAGVTGVDAANLNAVNAGVDAVASDDVDTVAEIQAIAAAGNTTADAAMTKIATYADNTNTPNDALAPSVADYLAAGVTGVDTANLNAVNAGVDAVASDDVDTVAEIQAIAAAGNTTADAAMTKIATYADNTNTPNDALAPSVADYLAAGVTGVDAANLNAVNAGVDAVASDDVDTVAEIQAIAAAGNTTADAAMTKIATYADNTNTPNDALAPSVADYLAAGVTGVDTANLNAVNAGVDAVASDDVDTVAEIQAIAAAGNTTADAAMTKIATYADNTNTPNDALAPSVADYLAAGVTGVDAANLNAVNAGVDATNKDGVDTVAEIQAIAAAGNTTADAAMTKIATYADNTNTPNDALAPSVADYLAAGVTGVDAANLNAVNAGVDATNKDGVDTVAEIQAIAAAGNTTADAAMTKIATYADNTNTPNDALAPSVADYLAAGVTGVDTANLNAVNAGVDAVASDDVDTVAEIQAIAAAGNTTADAAMTKIATYADNTNTPNDALAPSVADYLAAGVTGVDTANLNAVNAGVDAVASDDVDTVAEIQAIAAAGNTTADAAMTKIATYADNTNTPNDALAPSVADYLAAGVTGVDAANLNAVNAGVDAVASDDVDTVAEIQAIAAAGNTTADAAMTKIATYADNTNTPNDALAPSVADYLAAGVTGVDTANLNAVNAGVDAVASDDVDTVAEIQAIAAAGNTTADAAMTKIATYADNTNTPNDALAPSVADYLAAGVTGVDTANLNAVNAGVDAVASDDVDTVAEIQAIAAAGNTTADAAMTKIATYADNTNTPNDALAPSVADYLAAGVTHHLRCITAFKFAASSKHLVKCSKCIICCCIASSCDCKNLSY